MLATSMMCPAVCCCGVLQCVLQYVCCSVCCNVCCSVCCSVCCDACCSADKKRAQLHCNSLQLLQHTATHCNCCNTLHTWQYGYARCTRNSLQLTATHCNSLQHTATHCHTTHTFVMRRRPLHSCLTATHCNSLQHTATHCNAL